MRWLKKRGLNFKVALGITITMAIILGASFVGISQYIRARLWQSEIQKTENINAIAEILLDDAMLAGRKDTVDNALSKLGQNVGNQQLSSIAVYDDQYVLTSFASGFPGSLSVQQESMPSSIKDPSCWGCHQLPPEERPTHLIVNVEGREVIRNSVPLYNEARCQACHGTGKQILGDIMVDFSQDQFKQAYANITLGLAGGMIFAIGLVVVVLYQVMRRIVLNPVEEVIQMADEMSHGALDQQIEVRSSDEIGILARAFNSMASQLRELVGRLEQRVAERTADFAEATRQSEKRASELKTVSEVTRAVSTEVNLESLLTLVTNLVSEQFGFYHVGIFLPDSLNQYAVLQASNSPGGKRMIARGHKLPVGQVGIVGYVASSHEARIALNVGEDAAFFNNPDLPETRSEMALPLRLRGRVIGVLDVQSVEANAFTEKDVETIGILADQIAIAIENIRLLAESKQALAESQSLYGDFINRTWERKTAQSAIGYYHTAGAGHLIDEPVEWDEVQNVLKTGRLVVTTPSHKSPTQATISAVAVPIRLQNQVIGILDIRSADPDRTWTEDEIAVIEATAERLALALENARMFEETSSRASREHAVAEITSKIRETNDPQVMIRTTIEELQRVLNVSRVEIIPQVVSAHLPGRENSGHEAS